MNNQLVILSNAIISYHRCNEFINYTFFTIIIDVAGVVDEGPGAEINDEFGDQSDDTKGTGNDFDGSTAERRTNNNNATLYAALFVSLALLGVLIAVFVAFLLDDGTFKRYLENLLEPLIKLIKK